MTRKFLTPVVLPADPAAPMEAATKQYVDAAAGGGSDEVFIGISDPIGTDPTTELWFDTDAPLAMPLDYRWNTAWGVVGEGIFTSTQAGFVGATVDVTNLTVTFTPVVGRRYIYRVKADVLTTVAGDVPVMTICDAANATLDRFTTQLTSTASETWAWATLSETFGTTTPVTRKVRLVRALGTGSLSVYATSGNPAKFIVEDAGPVAGAVPAPAQPTIGVEAAKPTAPASVMEYYATDTKRKWMWDGLEWVVLLEPWQVWTPTLVQGVAVGVSVTSARYTRIGKTVIGEFLFTATSSGTNGNVLSISAPVTPRTAGAVIRSIGTAYVNIGSVGQMMLHVVHPTNLTSFNFLRSNATNLSNYFGADPSVQIVSGNSLGGSFTYEAV